MRALQSAAAPLPFCESNQVLLDWLRHSHRHRLLLLLFIVFFASLFLASRQIFIWRLLLSLDHLDGHGADSSLFSRLGRAWVSPRSCRSRRSLLESYGICLTTLLRGLHVVCHDVSVQPSLAVFAPSLRMAVNDELLL